MKIQDLDSPSEQGMAVVNIKTAWNTEENGFSDEYNYLKDGKRSLQPLHPSDPIRVCSTEHKPADSHHASIPTFHSVACGSHQINLPNSIPAKEENLFGASGDQFSLSRNIPGGQGDYGGRGVVNNSSDFARLVLKKDYKLIEKRRTIFSATIRSNRVLEFLLKLYGNTFTSIFNTLIWLFFAIILMLVILGESFKLNRIAYLISQILFTSNFFVSQFLFLRLGVVREITRSFSFWFTVWSFFSFIVCIELLYGVTIAINCALIHTLSSKNLLLFYDSHVGKKRISMKLANIFGILSYTPAAIVILFRIYDFEHEYIYLPFLSVKLINLRLQALDNISTFIIYLLRISFNHIVLKKSDVVAFVSHYYELSYSAENDNPVFNSEKVQYPNASDMNNNANDNGPHIINNIVRQNLEPHKFMKIGIFQDKEIQIDLRKSIYAQYMVAGHPRLTNVVSSKGFFIAITFVSVISIGLSFLVLMIHGSMESMYISLSLIVAVIGTLLFIFHIAIYSNWILLRYMGKSFDFWYIAFLVFKSFISIGVLLKWNKFTFLILPVVMAIFWCISIDCFHASYREYTWLSSALGFTTFLMAILCKLRVGDTFENDTYLVVGGIQVMSANITFSTSMFYTSLFLLRFHWSYHCSNHRMFFVTENILVTDAE